MPDTPAPLPDHTKLPAPLWAYREPPAGLNLEGQRVYVALVDPLTIVASFRPDSARRGSRELFVAWHNALRRSEQGMVAVLQFLRGRSPRTWRAGQAIRAAIGPVSAALCVAGPNLPHYQPTAPHVPAEDLCAGLGDRLSRFNPVPLLDELAAAVVADYPAQDSRPATRPDNDAPKGKPGRRGYPVEALDYAKELRRKNPTKKATWLRNQCLAKFSEDDLPPDADSFRRWLNRRRANRAN